jgi:hypothetical protein
LLGGELLGGRGLGVSRGGAGGVLKGLASPTCPVWNSLVIHLQAFEALLNGGVAVGIAEKP